ncbi:MAG: glycosyltransferase [Sterolibacterium sp.]
MTRNRIVTLHTRENPLLDALQAEGCEIVQVPARQSFSEELFDDCLCYFGDAFINVKAPLQFARLKKQLNRRGIPVVSWNRDAPWHCAIKPWRKILIRALRLVDIYLTHSLQDAAAFHDAPIYFPNAAQIHSYHLGTRTLADLRDPHQYRVDVSFFGALSPDFKQVRERVAFLQALAPRLDTLKITHDFRDPYVYQPRMGFAEQIEFVQRSRINLNVGAVCDTPEPSWGLAERCYGVPACGGFLLSDPRRHAADTFPADSWVEFASLDDCVEKIQAHLRDFERTRALAEKLHAEVMQHHTYRNRAWQFLRLVNDFDFNNRSRRPAGAQANA